MTYPKNYDSEVVTINTQKLSVTKKVNTQTTSKSTGIILVYFLPRGPSINLEKIKTPKTPTIF